MLAHTQAHACIHERQQCYYLYISLQPLIAMDRDKLVKLLGGTWQGQQQGYKNMIEQWTPILGRTYIFFHGALEA